MSKTFCMSDIHGHYQEMMALYKKLPINPKRDKMVFLGDYIDRGPDSDKVIQQLIDWKKKYPHWVVLLGNHEDLMLDTLVFNGKTYGSFDLWYQQGGKQTHYSYCKNMTDYEKAISAPEDVIPLEHFTFLTELPVWHEDDNYFYVHGGLIPGQHPKDSDPYDLMWIRDQFINSTHDWGKKVIFGHTPRASFKPWIMKNKIGIDTAVGPPANNVLTCVELPAEKFYTQKNLHKS